MNACIVFNWFLVTSNMNFMLDVTKNQFKKNPTNVHCAPSSGHHGLVPRARAAMDMGVGYNGHVYRHVWGTSCVNQHIVNSEMKNKKVIFKCRNFIMGVVRLKKYIFSEDRAPWTLMPIMGHHGHVHGTPKHVHYTPSMVLQHDDCYKCSFN